MVDDGAGCRSALVVVVEPSGQALGRHQDLADDRCHLVEDREQLLNELDGLVTRCASRPPGSLVDPRHDGRHQVSASGEVAVDGALGDAGGRRHLGVGQVLALGEQLGDAVEDPVAYHRLTRFAAEELPTWQ